MKIIFCIPGRTFSRYFLNSWSNLINELKLMDIEWELITDYYPYLHKVRNAISQRAIQKEYDYLMWIDSDMVFKPIHFKNLLSHKDKCDIVSGVYFAQNGTDIYNTPIKYACMGMNEEKLNKWEVDKYVRDGTPLNYNFGTDAPDGLIQVRANGMGWMLVKKGVFESIEDPFDVGMRKGEDIVFQVKALEKGFKSYVDPTIIVGHEKSLILR